jgi:hypothetical protein
MMIAKIEWEKYFRIYTYLCIVQGLMFKWLEVYNPLVHIANHDVVGNWSSLVLECSSYRSHNKGFLVMAC